MGWRDPEPEQVSLPGVTPGGDPNLSASPNAPLADGPEDPPGKPHAPGDANLSAFPSSGDEAVPVSFDRDPADRRVDRVLAYLGLLNDAAPLFRSGRGVPRAGVLLALPALVDTGVFAIGRTTYGSIGPAFYGLRTTLVALLLMALLRIKRPEMLKEHAPEDLGRVLGLDRAPEVKTLRRKLSRLATVGRAAEFGRALAERRVAERGAALGFLYVDGHVRVYHRTRTLPKAHVARMRLSMPATTDSWVNDAAGDPLFVVTAEANAGMVKMLPSVLEEVRALVGERRVTVVFDRGGYSPKLFRTLITDGFDILTYRKGRSPRGRRSRFGRHEKGRDRSGALFRPRALAHRPGRSGAPDTPALPWGQPGSGDRARRRGRHGPGHRLHAAAEHGPGPRPDCGGRSWAGPRPLRARDPFRLRRDRSLGPTYRARDPGDRRPRYAALADGRAVAGRELHHGGRVHRGRGLPSPRRAYPSGRRRAGRSGAPT